MRYLTIAGDRAFDAAAFDDAVGHFEHALSLIPSADQLGRAELLERLAMALRSVGRWDDALRTMNDALDRYEALGQVEAIGQVGLGHGVPAGVDGSAGRRRCRSASGRWRHSATP